MIINKLLYIKLAKLIPYGIHSLIHLKVIRCLWFLQEVLLELLNHLLLCLWNFFFLFFFSGITPIVASQLIFILIAFMDNLLSFVSIKGLLNSLCVRSFRGRCRIPIVITTKHIAFFNCCFPFILCFISFDPIKDIF